jgi:hypothetical protein
LLTPLSDGRIYSIDLMGNFHDIDSTVITDDKKQPPVIDDLLIELIRLNKTIL